MKKSVLIFAFFIFMLALSAVASEDVESEKAKVDLIIDVVDFGDYLEVNVNLPQDALGTVNYTVNGEEYLVNVAYGNAKLNISGLDPGDYILKANYSGDDAYMSVENFTSITVSEAENTTDNVTDQTDDNRTAENATFPDDNDTNQSSSNSSDAVNNTPASNSSNVSNSTPQVNNTTVTVTVNQTQNQTPAVENTSTSNITTVVDHSPKEPKKVPNKNPLNLDPKTGLPIILVIIAAAILVVVRKYNF